MARLQELLKLLLVGVLVSCSLQGRDPVPSDKQSLENLRSDARRLVELSPYDDWTWIVEDMPKQCSFLERLNPVSVQVRPVLTRGRNVGSLVDITFKGGWVREGLVIAVMKANVDGFDITRSVSGRAQLLAPDIIRYQTNRP